MTVDQAVSAYEDASWKLFEKFNRLVGFGQPAPYPAYARLRAQAPVHPGLPHLGIPPDPHADAPTFTVFGYDAAVEALLDPERFSSTAYDTIIGHVFGRSVIEMDPPEHRDYRMLLQPSLGPRTMSAWNADIIAPLITEMIGDLRPRGSADLVRELLFAFPMRTFAAMLGLPDEQYPVFHRYATELITLSYDVERGRACAAAVGELLGVVLDARRAEPRNDLMTVLAQAEHEGQRLEDEEIFSFLRLLLPAGAETTYRASSSLLTALLSDPDLADAVRDDPALRTAAVNEAFRWEPPLQFVPRRAQRDVVLGGVAIPAGSTVIVNLGAANHDPARWEDPERFDPHRPHQPALAFGHGAHLCIGMHLSKIEVEGLLAALLTELPNLRLDPAAEPPAVQGVLMRSAPRLDVVWDV